MRLPYLLWFARVRACLHRARIHFNTSERDAWLVNLVLSSCNTDQLCDMELKMNKECGLEERLRSHCIYGAPSGIVVDLCGNDQNRPPLPQYAEAIFHDVEMNRQQQPQLLSTLDVAAHCASLRRLHLNNVGTDLLNGLFRGNGQLQLLNKLELGFSAELVKSPAWCSAKRSVTAFERLLPVLLRLKELRLHAPSPKQYAVPFSVIRSSSLQLIDWRFMRKHCFAGHVDCPKLRLFLCAEASYGNGIRPIASVDQLQRLGCRRWIMIADHDRGNAVAWDFGEAMELRAADWRWGVPRGEHILQMNVHSECVVRDPGYYIHTSSASCNL